MGCNIADAYELPEQDCSIPDGATVAYNGGSGNPSCSQGSGGLNKSAATIAPFDIAVTHFGQQMPFTTHSYSDTRADAFITNCRKRVAILGRWDIFFDYNFDNNSVNRPDLSWGTLCPLPTAAMGSQPRDGYSWASAVAQLNAAGYTQDVTIGSHPPAITTNPYRISLNAATKKFSVVGNKMNVNDDAWINLYCKYVKGLIDNTSATTFILTPQKIQTHRTGANFAHSDAFAHWLQGTTGTTGTGCRQQGNVCQTCDPVGCVAWDLVTNTGGPKGPWGILEEIYDDPAENMCDLIEGWFKMADCLKANGVETIFSLDNSAVRSNRNAVHWRQFQEEWVAKYGGTFADARQYFWDEIERMAMTMDGFMVDPTYTASLPPAAWQPYEPSATWYQDLLDMSPAGIVSPIQSNGCQQY